MLELRDAAQIGLMLRVMPSGTKSWSFTYVRPSDKKRQRAKIGKYPTISLEKARAKAVEMRNKINNEGDPAGEARAAKAALTFRQVADGWMELHTAKHKRPKSAKEDRRVLDTKILPAIGLMKASQVTTGDVNALIDGIAEKAPIAANRTLALCRTIFRWGVRRKYLVEDPTEGVGMPGVEEVSERVLTDTEITEFWKGLDRAKMSPGLRIAFKLALLTGQREGNIAGMARANLDLSAADGNGRPAPAWVIPRAQMKAKSKKGTPRPDHRVPLSPLVVALINEALAIADAAHGNDEAGDQVRSPWVFPGREGRGVSDKPMGGHALNTANLRARAAGTWGIAAFRVHDLRHTMATGMGELGVFNDVIGLILDHAATGVTGKVYNKSSYDQPKRAALEAWSAKVEVLVGLRAGSNVVVLRPATAA